MLDQKIYLREGFFKFLVSLEELKEKKERLIFVSSIGINEDTFIEFTNYLTSFEILVLFDENYVYPLKDNQVIHLDLSVSEWFSLQASVAIEKEFAPYSHKILKNKIELVQNANSRFNLFRSNTEEIKGNEKLIMSNENNCKVLENYISKKVAVKLFFSKDKLCDLLPLRIVYLDGILCLIGEEVLGRNLSYFAVEDIKKIEVQELSFDQHISQIEVNDFIENLRMINGNEERLILKIFSPGESDLLPHNHYLGNPFVTSNPEGDMIWAASIEMCEDIYNWLYKMKDHVEVLDPGHIRKEFSHFCNLKIENADFKKVS